MLPNHGPGAEQEWCNTMLSFLKSKSILVKTTLLLNTITVIEHVVVLDPVWELLIFIGSDSLGI